MAIWTDITAQTIHSTNGRTYDLTALETPLALLPDDVLHALRTWPHGLLLLASSGEWVSCAGAACIESTYRAKPAPKVTEHVLYWEPDWHASKGKCAHHTHKITIRDDGRGNLTADVEALE